MKKLGKKLYLENESVEAYACYCTCTCSCYNPDLYADNATDEYRYDYYMDRDNIIIY